RRGRAQAGGRGSSLSRGAGAACPDINLADASCLRDRDPSSSVDMGKAAKAGGHVERSGRTRDRLVTTAMRVFNQVGFWGTDSNELARAAGYSPGTFYRHFADKRAIFLAAYQSWAAAEDEQLTARIAKARERG